MESSEEGEKRRNAGNKKKIIVIINCRETKKTSDKIKYFSLEKYSIERTIKHPYSHLCFMTRAT